MRSKTHDREPEDLDEAKPGLFDLAGLLLTREEEERLAYITDSLGRNLQDAAISPQVLRRSLAVFKQLYLHYFRVQSSGHKFIPEKGAAILAANHGGLLPFDAAMIVVDVFQRVQPPHLLRVIVDRWAASIPFLNVFFARVGQGVASRQYLRRLLEGDQLVLIFPEGIEAMAKLTVHRYQLQRFHLGFAKASLEHRVPIIPTAIVGAEEQAPVLYDVKPLARLLGLPVFPITPTFPLLGLPGLLPYPVKYKIRYGEPQHVYREFEPGDEENPEALQLIADRIRLDIQAMVDAMSTGQL